MKTRNIILLLLGLGFYLPLLYVLIFEPDLARPYTFAEIGPKLILLIFFPICLGIVLWFWALYDWGTRHFTPIARIAWLLTLISTLYLGATIYFLAVGLRSPETSVR
jgi:hypothetical protein